jgi:hypothetical protein
MPIIAAGVTAGATLLSGFFGSRSSAAAQKRNDKQNFLDEQYFNNQARQDALEQRQYREKAIGAYRQFGSAGLASPAYTDPNSIVVKSPY